jgi:hypothetical protein
MRFVGGTPSSCRPELADGGEEKMHICLKTMMKVKTGITKITTMDIDKHKVGDISRDVSTVIRWC